MNMNMNVHQSLVAAWIGSEDLHQASGLFWKTEPTKFGRKNHGQQTNITTLLGMGFKNSPMNICG